MKTILLIIGVFVIQTANSQQSTPPERFSVEGAITIGDSDTPLPPDGTIRWNPETEDFEGFTGQYWVSLTSGSSEYGSVTPYRYESYIIYDQNGLANENYGEDVGTDGLYNVVGVPETNGSEGAVFLYANGDLISKIELSGTTELGERVDISENWIAIGADDGNAYIYNIPDEKIEQLKLETPIVFSEFVALDGELLAIKGVDSTIYTFIENGGNWDFIGQTSSKEVAASQFDISMNGHLVAGELGETHTISFELNNDSWTEDQTIMAPTGYRSGNPALHKDKLAIPYNWIPPIGPQPGQIVPKQGFIKVFTYENDSWVEEAQIFVPNTISLGIPVLHDNTLIIGSDVAGASTGQVLHNGQGKVHVIKKEGDNWNYKYTLTSSDGRAGDIFGHDYDIGPNGIIVGTIWADLYVGTSYESEKQGKAYIFKK